LACSGRWKFLNFHRFFLEPMKVSVFSCSEFQKPTDQFLGLIVMSH
jgi:hypothetical protein